MTFYLKGRRVIIRLKERKPSMFNFTGIDANGLYNGEIGYTSPVAYAIGRWKYTYYKKIVPTPATEDEIIGKYYKNSTSGLLVEITSSTISSGLVVVGETDIYETTTNKDEADASGKADGDYNNGINSKYVGVDPAKKYTSSQLKDKDFGLDTIIIPDTHNGLPVKVILPFAFYAWWSNENETIAWVTKTTKHVKLGNNITHLSKQAFVHMCSWVNDESETSFELNDGLEQIDECALLGIYSNTYDLVLPNSVREISGTFSQKSGVYYTNNQTLNTLTMTGDFASSSYDAHGLASCAKYLIIDESVKNITGDLAFYANTSPVGNIVFKHGIDDTINLTIEPQKSAFAINIYTDNETIRNYDWASANYTVTFYPLSDYTGG